MFSVVLIIGILLRLCHLVCEHDSYIGWNGDQDIGSTIGSVSFCSFNGFFECFSCLVTRVSFVLVLYIDIYADRAWVYVTMRRHHLLL